MKLFEFVSERRWIPVAGYLFYVLALTAGYYYNLTFVQLGLIDLGTRLVGMTSREVSTAMALLALTTVMVAVAAGILMDRRGWSTNLHVKLRVLLLVVVVQLALTVFAPSIRSSAGFLIWILVCSTTLGVGIPVMFGTMIDFIPVRDRGYVAAAVAGLAFFVAALFPFEWRIEEFSIMLAAGMTPSALALGVLSFRRFKFIDELARQHHSFGTGRFCHPAPVRTMSVGFWGLIALMFGVFFIDSLGFLRIIDTPVLIFASWQSPELGTRLFIAIMHIVGALVAGVLYTNFGRRWLFLWMFGLFAFTHLLYTFHIRFGAESIPPLTLPMFYVLAVSFYTTLNFALWPDHSTAETIGTHTALGVGIAGMLASFLSTALALHSGGAGVSLVDHLTYVNAMALLIFFLLPVTLYARRMSQLAHERKVS